MIVWVKLINIHIHILNQYHESYNIATFIEFPFLLKLNEFIIQI